ncbi:Ferritin-like metal-binding protein YciE [Chitinophaga sp. CF118]|uniref:YciE/YciF ferroxidase family protein n=1 Tax=Chitinophaga sp. CF118 TaxID=1884367 RepID=UPI0008EF5586|nr:ferritin-like domain-containing protein [Chitinophaga sp. CF118]SFE23860.1 Ferritin-like metal-binding protein YciE [Chitinophaga sp. CF118]
MATKIQAKTGTNGTATKQNGSPKSVAAKNTVVVTRSASRAKPGSKKQDMPNSRFHKLFVDELKDIYWAAKALVKTLGKMQKAATSDELTKAISDHQEVTREQITRLEQVFESIDQEPKTKKCEAMAGLITESQEVVDDTDEDSAVRDVAIIICSQKIAHYQIAAYGSLRTLANVMGHTEAADFLAESLSEEKEADNLLTMIAESSVNEEASAE